MRDVTLKVKIRVGDSTRPDKWIGEMLHLALDDGEILHGVEIVEDEPVDPPTQV